LSTIRPWDKPSRSWLVPHKFADVSIRADAIGIGDYPDKHENFAAGIDQMARVLFRKGEVRI
jgi:hypothetical protein